MAVDYDARGLLTYEGYRRQERHAMAKSNEPARSDHSDRGRGDRIARLRERLSRAKAFGADADLCAVLAGVLDLLGDEP